MIYLGFPARHGPKSWLDKKWEIPSKKMDENGGYLLKKMPACEFLKHPRTTCSRIGRVGGLSRCLRWQWWRGELQVSDQHVPRAPDRQNHGRGRWPTRLLLLLRYYRKLRGHNILDPADYVKWFFSLQLVDLVMAPATSVRSLGFTPATDWKVWNTWKVWRGCSLDCW